MQEKPVRLPKVSAAKKREALAKLADAVPAGWLDALISISQDVIGSGSKSPQHDDRGMIAFLVDPHLRDAEDLLSEIAEIAKAILPKGRLKSDSNLAIELPQRGYAQMFTVRELAQFLKDAGIEYRFSRWFASDMLDELVPEAFSPKREGLIDAIVALMEAERILHGPCPECGRDAWVTPYRPRGARGRHPLTYTYCPPCAEAIQRKRDAERKREERAAPRKRKKPGAASSAAANKD